MKKLLIAFIIGAFAVACGDRRSETSGTTDDTETSGEVMEADSADMNYNDTQGDTLSTEGTEGEGLRTDTATQAP